MTIPRLVPCVLVAAILVIPARSSAFEPDPPGENETIYATVLMRAAPGLLLELIDLVEKRAEVLEQAGEQRPLILRHAQGDHWDLMVIQPIGTMEEQYAEPVMRRRALAGTRLDLTEPLYEQKLRELASWREETFYTGPSPEEFQAAVAPPAGYFHVEMFVALAGKHEELYRQRVMENDYLGRIDRPLNLIFYKTLGGPWDCFTLGLYRDLQHFAASADVPADVENEAAIAAGFESSSMIGPYMRSLINWHQDTIGRIIRQ
ncbi:hypothetical protein ACFL6R_05755 [Gemmatimonadota bacterium]